MRSPARFRQLFANRLGSAIGLSGLVLPVLYACSGTAVIDSAGAGGATSSSNSANNASSNNASSNNASSNNASSSGVGGAGGAGCFETSTGVTGGAIPTYQYSLCLDGLNTPCPGDPESAWDLVQEVLNQDCCTVDDSCEVVKSVDCGPFVASNGQSCCFDIVTEETFCAVPGRPFVEAGEARLAALREPGTHEPGVYEPGTRAGWSAAIAALALDGLSLAEREQLADKWARDGLAEHASIASFARFSLHLMAVGAPSELVALAQRAALDEVEHARLAFAVASAYAGRAIEPGALPMANEGFAVTLAELARTTALEGCVNETLSTLVAREELEQTTDPALRAILSTIVEDETRHAELAWRTVAWALSVGGDDVRAALEAAFAPALASRDPRTRDVIAPLARGLLGAPASVS